MSKKSVSGFVSVMGALLGFITNLVAAFTKRGGTDEQLHELFVGKKSEEFIAKVADLAMSMVGEVRNGLHIVVDYSKSLVQMIAVGTYDWVNSDITAEHFPAKGEGRVELVPELVHYGKFMNSDDIVQDLDQRGFRPATLPELLAYGEKYPDKQRKFPIVALGSVWRYWDGARHVACLDGPDSRRWLHLNIWESGWYGCYHFLAFRK